MLTFASMHVWQSWAIVLSARVVLERWTELVCWHALSDETVASLYGDHNQDVDQDVHHQGVAQGNLPPPRLIPRQQDSQSRHI